MLDWRYTMDVELLIAKLLLRGFEHYKDDDDDRGGKMYINDKVAVVIRGERAVVGIEFYSVDEILVAVDYATEKADVNSGDT